MLSDASSFGRPLHEPYLRHQLRLHALHLPHLASRHAADPAGGNTARSLWRRVGPEPDADVREAPHRARVLESLGTAPPSSRLPTTGHEPQPLVH